ncbi:ChrR family anti-sigma-E factor [Maricurvus nonylphenolicus]|uniref:ChrR family anti-sigma-E factor n=1 Tax=Maricurvus nonylphenolicus TaxID=1008307 RepID=UPI0036F38742
MIRHHPPTEVLAAYAAGSLPLGHGLCVAAHLQYCPQCRQLSRQLNHLGGELLDQLPAADISHNLRDQVLAQLDSRDIPAQPEPPQAASLIPGCLRQLVPEGFDALPWTRLSPSIRASKLSHADGAKVELIAIKPGGQVAAHNHTGTEITVVLKGSFSDADGVYNQGDIILRDESNKNHRPIASQDSECICLTAVDAPIEFTGFFARLFNPLIRRSHYAS